MPVQKPKPNPVGRPKLPKGAAKAGAVQVRLSPDDRKRVAAAAKASKQTVSEWIRSTISAGIRDKNMEKLDECVKVLKRLTGKLYNDGFYEDQSGDSGYRATFRDGTDWYEYLIPGATVAVPPSEVASAMKNGQNPTRYGLLKFTQSETIHPS
jgi:hypothetical protein